MFLLSVNIVLRGHHENYDHIINMNVVWEQNQSNQSNKFYVHVTYLLMPSLLGGIRFFFFVSFRLKLM